MQITVVSVTVETKPTQKGSYQVAVVAYKDEHGKIQGKNVMSFGATAETFKVLSQASQGETYEITTVKNDKGYWDWTSAGRAVAQQAPSNNPLDKFGGKSNNVPKSTYETQEERAKKQVYIIRQSSLSTAVASLSVGSKSALKPEDVIAVAKQYEDFVFGNTQVVLVEDTTMVKQDDFINDELPF